MAKSKKSKILAMALCASVMAGIYASPVMAAEVNVTRGNLTGVTIQNRIDYSFTGGTLDLDDADIAGALNGQNVNLGTGAITANSITSTAGITAAGGQFQVYGKSGGIAATSLSLLDNNDSQNVLITNSGMARFGDSKSENVRIENGVLRVFDGNTELASLTSNGLTLNDGTVQGSLTATQLATINSAITTQNNKTVITGDELNIKGASGGLYVRDVVNGEKTMIYTKAADDTNTVWIDPENGNISTIGTVGVTDDLESDELITQIQGYDPKNPENTGDIAVGIQYDGAGNITGQNIVLDASTGDIIAKGTLSGTGLAAKGATGGLYVKDVTNNDGVTGTMIYTKAADGKTSTMWIDPNTGNLNAVGSIGVGSNLAKPVTQINGIADANGDGVGDINVGISYNEDGSVAGKKINLDASTGDINLVDGAKVDGVDVSELSKNVGDIGADLGDNGRLGGITRTDEDNDDKLDTTTIEGKLSVSGDKINMFGDTGLTFDKGTMNNVNVINVSGNIGFNGDNVHFSYGSGDKTNTLGGLALTVDQIANDVSAIKEKTDHITVDDKGNVTISADDGSSLTVGKDGTSTGQGGQVTTDGNHTVNGDLDVDSSGQIDKDLTVGGDLEVGGKIDASEVNVGNTHITKDNGIETDKITVSGQGGSAIINGGYVGGSNDVFIDANGNNIFDEGETSLSGVNGKVDKVASDLGDVSILDPEIAGDSNNDGQNDVVGAVNNEAEIRRSEIERVDGRINNLENRVGELEDRIDKVGAMAAAIANLRTMGYDPAAPTEVAVGIGQYRDETGAALGLFHYPNRDFMLSLSVSTSGDEVMGGIGATWKFGRKSPEKVAEIKKAQAEADARRAEEAKLAKAEEMKQAAKEAKIKAQQERHAKLAAERAAQAEAAK